MKILQIVSEPQRRGAEIFARQLSERFEAMGHATSIVYLYPGRTEHGIPLREQDRCLEGDRGSLLERIPGFDPLLVLKLLRVVDEEKPDVVQVNGSRSVKYGCLARRLRRRQPWKLIYRNIGDPRSWIRGGLKAWIYSKILIPATDGIVGVSGASLQAVLEIHGYRGPAVHIPRAVEVENFSAAESREEVRARLGTSHDTGVLLFVGRLSREKRPDRAVRLLLEIHRRGIDKTELWFVGEGDIPQVDGSSPGLRVRAFGVQEDVTPFLEAADLLVLTSDTEGMPGVILEAARQELPCVATRVGGVAECVVEGETGLLVEPDDERALADAAAGLLADPGRRQDMGRAASDWVRQHFDLDRISESYIDFYVSVTGEHVSEPQ